MKHPAPRWFFRIALAGVVSFSWPLRADTPKTERQYLSGHGPKDAVPWEFTVTGGRRAGEKTTIPVPSNWEQQGFGSYNYGQDAQKKSDEHGLYRLHFTVPESWKGRRIELVFDGVMTDATVKVNGQYPSPSFPHVGGFYRFRHDITSSIKIGGAGDNLLEVDVAKVSSNRDTELAERGGDYWVFGGIFRPVWLEAVPIEAIQNSFIDARADGEFAAKVWIGIRFGGTVEAQIFSADGQPVGGPFSASKGLSTAGSVELHAHIDSPRLWTAESPNLYSVRFTLRQGTEELHTTTERFGFRTFEVRPGQGLFLNGQRILLKGVDRHSFRPETARTLSSEDCYDDVRLIKEMNMNAVRMSHYPPDEAFLNACDALGLYVLDELSGWHRAHDTQVGQQLVREMVMRDVNHPSILFWDNGNEGGWNRELDGEFARYDPQQRRVLHPWELHGDVDTKHYPNFEDLTKRLQGPNILMPTEFLHGLYDGGAGAGLEDYWNAISKSPFGGGGFIWVFADEGIVRTDQGGRVDVFSTYAPDGIVGPHHEKEGSFYTVRDLWSPVQIAAPVLDEKFDGTLTVTNHYDFTSLSQCRFVWELVRFLENGSQTRQILTEGWTPHPEIAPHTSGKLTLSLPSIWQGADALVLMVFGPDGKELWTSTWPTSALAKRMEESFWRRDALVAQGTPKRDEGVASPKVAASGGEISLTAGGAIATFDAETGLLKTFRRGEKISALTNGPRLAFARPASVGVVEWLPFAEEDSATQTRALAAPHLANSIEVELAYDKTVSYAGFKLEISPDRKAWKTIFDATRRSGDGKSYNFPPQPVAAVRLSNALRSDGAPIAVNAVRLGYAAARFPAAATAPATVSSGTERDVKSGSAIAWIESRTTAGLDRFRWTLREDGSLQLDYNYALEGEFLYHGITFDHAEEQMKSLRWLGEGPYRVWQNRLRGTWLGVHEIARNDLQPGESWSYPEFQGCFAGLRWARLDTSAGPLTIASASPEIYLRVGTPRISHQNTTVEFPAGDLSFLHAIPAIGSKFITPEKTGPASQPAKATGSYSGTLIFRLDP